MVPEAPLRLSMRMFCFRPCDIFCATMRVATSVGPPGGKGTTTVIGLAGQASAKAAPATSGSARAMSARRAGLRREREKGNAMTSSGIREEKERAPSENAVRFKLRELVVRKAEQRLQHLVRAFAQLRRRTAHRQALAVEAVGRGQHIDLAGHRMRLLGDKARVGRALGVERLEQA